MARRIGVETVPLCLQTTHRWSKIPMMSDCLLRISEVVAVNIEDVDTTLTIRSSKTDQEGKGESLFIGEPTLDAIESTVNREK